MAKTKTELCEWISSGFTRVEDVAYVGRHDDEQDQSGDGKHQTEGRQKTQLEHHVVECSFIVEILYTLQVSFREHTLIAEPFLIDHA
jgi:hypothetical protein